MEYRYVGVNSRTLTQRSAGVRDSTNELFSPDGRLLIQDRVTGIYGVDRNHVYVAGQRVAEYVTSGFDVEPPASELVGSFIHSDPLGSPVLSTDSKGLIEWREDYRPYGEPLRKESLSTKSTVKFAGKPYDPLDELSYFGARYYSPTLGRFMGVDPAPIDPSNPHSINRYAYANNNPYKFVDPDGRNPIDAIFLAYDLGKMGAAIATGGDVKSAAVDVGISMAAIIVPIPGMGQAVKAARAADHAVDVARAAAKEAPAIAGAFSKDKQALVEMARADKRIGMTSADMAAYKDLNRQLKDPFPSNKVRGPEAHTSGAPSSQAPHGHVGPIDHIPIRDPRP